MMAVKGLIFIFLFITIFHSTNAGVPDNARFIYFPNEASRKFNCSAGILFSTTHPDITEEFQFRIPAIDIHATRKIYRSLFGNASINSQILQNHFLAGLKLIFARHSKLCMSIEDNFAFWQGKLDIEGFKISARGWINYPGISAGLRIDNDILLTLKAEAILSLGRKRFVGKNLTDEEYSFYNGEAVSLILEQPFYHKRWFVLGFRALYVNDFWQTWPLFEPLDRNTFYPQIIMGLML
jgi:hypothetical protein